MQASDAVSLGRAKLALGAGAESMSRNPVAAYTHRGGFRMGQVEFKDFLWEALLDPVLRRDHGRHRRKPRAALQICRAGSRRVRRAQFRARARARAERLLRRRDRRRSPTRRSSSTAHADRGIRLTRKRRRVAARQPCAALAGRGAGENPSGLRRRADRRQFARRVVDGAAAALVASGAEAQGARQSRWRALVAGAAVGVRAGVSWGSARCPRSRPCWKRAGSDAGRHRPVRDQRGVRRASAWPARANSGSTRTSSTSTAAPSPSATRSARPASGSR